MKIRVVITGRGYDAATSPGEVDLPAGAAVSDAIEAVLGSDVAAHLTASTLVIASGRHLGTLGGYENATLNDGDELMLLQPVAGG
jgi:molybdopterin converting factor small subunit